MTLECQNHTLQNNLKSTPKSFHRRATFDSFNLSPPSLVLHPQPPSTAARRFLPHALPFHFPIFFSFFTFPFIFSHTFLPHSYPTTTTAPRLQSVNVLSSDSTTHSDALSSSANCRHRARKTFVCVQPIDARPSDRALEG
jgi:hypothetical protein